MWEQTKTEKEVSSRGGPVERIWVSNRKRGVRAKFLGRNKNVGKAREENAFQGAS